MKDARIFVSIPLSDDVDNWVKEMTQNSARLQKCDDLARKQRTLVGRVFRVSVADGYAAYQIIKENGRMVKIQCCTGLGDDWRDHHFMAGGTFSKKDVMRYIQWEESLHKLFDRKPVK